MESRTCYDVYLSYEPEHRDNVKTVETYLSKNHINAWMDVKEMRPNEDLDEALARGIIYSKVTICFLSKSYLKSENCLQDLKFAKQLNKRVIFILLEEITEDDFKSVTNSTNSNRMLKLFDKNSRFTSSCLDAQFLNFLKQCI